MLPEEIKQYILTLKHCQEMCDVIMHPLKQTLNREIKNYNLVMNEIQYKRSLPHIKTVALKIVFCRRRNRSKYRKPEFVCPFYSKCGPYWYYHIYICIVYIDQNLYSHTYNTILGNDFEEGVAKMNSEWNPFLLVLLRL